MNHLSFILRIGAIAGAVAAGIFFFSSQGKLGEQQKKLRELQVELLTTKDAADASIKEYTELKEKIAEKDVLLESNHAELDAIRAELLAEQQEVSSLQIALEESQILIDNSQSTVERLREELIQTEKLLAVSSREGEVAQMSERIDELLAVNESLKRQLGDSDIKVDLEPYDLIEIDSILPVFTTQTLTEEEANELTEVTTIASVDTKNGIIVLDTIPSLNSMENTVIKLVKDLEVIAQLELRNVSDAFVIANILPGAELDNLGEGDTVKLIY